MDKEEGMSRIGKDVESCRKCGLCKTRNRPVVGAGSLDAGIMFIGEAPGFKEDLQGKPFVGRAGEVFDELLKSVGLERRDVYIANLLKCRPPGNRSPSQEEIKTCTPYLDEQLSIIRPGVIATLGSFSMSYIFGKFGLREDKISRIHGRVFRISNLAGTRKIIPLYHPAVATYNPGMKGVLLEDFKSLGRDFGDSQEG
jgi:uracil-DNA glycosylase family 4